MARMLRDRLIFELESIRKELIDTVSPVTDLDYAPAEGMKPYDVQLREIGAMEAESSILLRTGRVPTWEECEACITGTTTEAILASLAEVRRKFIDWLSAVEDEHLREPIPIPEEWWSYLGDRELEREELVRWVARHEYYHLGQIIIYRWIQGHNPYVTIAK